jgi:AcrR family transcriptional regulator
MRRREELVGAARRVIGRDGFAAATVGEITREAGASLGLLNYHFGSKDEVVAEAFAEAAREELSALEAISRRFEDLPTGSPPTWPSPSGRISRRGGCGSTHGASPCTPAWCGTRWGASRSAGAPCSPRS